MLFYRLVFWGYGIGWKRVEGGFKGVVKDFSIAEWRKNREGGLCGVDYSKFCF